MKKQGSVLLLNEDLASLLSHGNPAPATLPPPASHLLANGIFSLFHLCQFACQKKKKVTKIICIALKVYLCKMSSVLNCGSSDQL